MELMLFECAPPKRPARTAMSAMEEVEDIVDMRVGDGDREDSRSRTRSGESSLSDPAAACCCFSSRDNAILYHAAMHT